ncbi:class I SAM-dependent methyltransferase [Candidatus Falkowbacteria bacterium HGW-Falkowbacteria-1]|uniref:Class I SAM-dependent methyltransferase n=1 Tax=Candidatus Falkowbacteria bacterium HGW-Falkowbacteria-1 TaxID=2013768 RepID=A0A2N2E929_9BACT|nr:MAG: class I SAM-dependent methyltransferase [Candidatus Falkowbacteria bacterium HGW-Falkowbacteria-1]
MKNVCKICGDKTREIFHEKLNIKYFQCLSCDFIFKGDEFIISSEEELARYNRHNNSIDDQGYVEYFKKFIDTAIIPYCSGTKNVLDFGCGPSPVLAEILKKDYNFSVDIYDLFYFPEKNYEGKKYDLIVSTEVVEHLKNPLDYFLEFAKLLKDGGLLSVMTLFHPSDDERFKSWWYINDVSHIGFYNLKTFEEIAKKVGLEIIYTNNKNYITFKK